VGELASIDAEALVAAGVPAGRAAELARGAARLVAAEAEAPAAWRRIAGELLAPDDAFEAHRRLYRAVYASWGPERPPPPAWIPSPGEIARTNLASLGTADVTALHRRSVEEPEGYWPEVLARLRTCWHAPPRCVLDARAGAERAEWLVGARLNAAEGCFAGRDEARPALVWRREGSGGLERMTLGELRRESERVGAALVALGFGPGDPIAVAMPMTPESVAIYLGIVLVGGVVVSIADSFAAPEIALRLRIAGARAVFTQDVILRGERALPLYERVCEAAAPRAVVLPAGPRLALPLRDGDLAWDDFRARVGGDARPRVHVAGPGESTNILFSSGTTGEPKAILWDHVTPLKSAADGWAHHDLGPGDVVVWPTNLGWMMGPWLIYASLMNDATIGLFVGSPLGRAFGSFVAEAGVTMLGVVPSLVRSWRETGAMEGLDWSRLRRYSSTGEASSPEEMLWLMARAGYKPILEYCGGTEIGGGYITGTLCQPQAPATFSTPAMGAAFILLDEEGREADVGELALHPPMLGSSSRLLNRDHHEAYFAGMPAGPGGRTLRRHGDQMQRLPGGYYRALGRVDDTMNLGGIKTSSAELERAVEGVAGLRETAAVAVEPPGGGPSLLVLFAVPGPGERPEPGALAAELGRAIRERLSPLFKLHDVVVVDALPRTASNKVMRRTLRAQYARAPARMSQKP
jgi:acetyl-CoA synthetase